jgi:pyruvate/2-oxoglutarate dehydrogenase complex dihydrolipoamide dehydrogenase (E3) component
MPRVTFTDPEVAQVGLTSAEARAAHPDSIVATWPIQRIDRAVCEHDTSGMLKLIAARSGEILGATILGERAGEAIMEIVMAMQQKLKLSDVASIIHPYPTYNSGIQLLASEMAMEKAFDGMAGRSIRAVSRAIR